MWYVLFVIGFVVGAACQIWLGRAVTGYLNRMQQLEEE